jgi:hypothetical protein
MLKFNRFAMEQSVSYSEVINVLLSIWAIEMKVSVVLLIFFFLFMMFNDI